LLCNAGHGGVKTFAIIIGSLAGLAILIIFLAFMSRICGRQGKYYICTHTYFSFIILKTKYMDLAVYTNMISPFSLYLSHAGK